ANPNWTAYVLTTLPWQFSQDPTHSAADTNYVPVPGAQTATTLTVNSMQTTIPYWMKIRHKREYDAEQAGHTPSSPHYVDGDGSTAAHTPGSPGNIIYYGHYPPGALTPVQFTAPGPISARPVELARVYDASGHRWIEVDVVPEVGPPVLAALYAKGSVAFNVLPAGLVSGTDNCGVGNPAAPVYTVLPWLTIGSPSYQGTPAVPQQGNSDLDLSAYIESVKTGATVLTSDQNSQTFGTPSNYVTVYSNTMSPLNVGGLRLKDVTGYGLLLVDGDLLLEQNTSWYGDIVVSGLLTFKNNVGQLNIRGRVLAGIVATLDANPDIRYDSCELAKALGSRPVKLTRWQYRS
ncbi:MAG: hypothetical protein ACREI3_07825, partial [Nitrospirales bacterium]